MPNKRNQRWVKGPKEPKRGGWTTDSKGTKTFIHDGPINGSAADTVADGWDAPSTSTGKARGTNIKPPTWPEKASSEVKTTPASATRPGVSYAAAAAAAANKAIGAKEPQKNTIRVNLEVVHGKACDGKSSSSDSSGEGGALNENPGSGDGESNAKDVDWGEGGSAAQHADWGDGESNAKDVEWAEHVPLPEPFDPMGMTSDPAHPDTRIPFILKDESLICCIDLENNCHNQSREDARKGIRSKVPRTCEVGVALVDARKLSWENKGHRWEKAWPVIEGEDYAIIEHEHKAPHHRAYDCGQGRPEYFLYGEPTWVSLADVKDVVVSRIRSMLGKCDEVDDSPTASCPGKGKAEDILTHPCQKKGAAEDNSAPLCQSKEEAKDDSVPPLQSSENEESQETKDNSKTPSKSSRRIVFVFFACRNDLRWLANLGIDLTGEFPNSCIVDLQRSFVARSTADELNKAQCSFDDYMSTLNLNNPGAHNGGNDAVHGLQAFLAEIAMTADLHDKTYDGGSPELPIKEEESSDEWKEASSSEPQKTAPSNPTGKGTQSPW